MALRKAARKYKMKNMARRIILADQPTGDYHSSPEAASTGLHRDLKARHITMIAVGGAIGTGLIIGTGAALARAGYVNSVL